MTEQVFYTITKSFVDDYIGTLSEEEFLEWVELSEEEEDFEEILEVLRKRLERLEYYELIAVLNNKYERN